MQKCYRQLMHPVKNQLNITRKCNQKRRLKQKSIWLNKWPNQAVISLLQTNSNTASGTKYQKTEFENKKKEMSLSLYNTYKQKKKCASEFFCHVFHFHLRLPVFFSLRNLIWCIIDIMYKVPFMPTVLRKRWRGSHRGDPYHPKPTIQLLANPAMGLQHQMIGLSRSHSDSRRFWSLRIL